MSIAIIANPLAGRGRGAKTAQLAEKILNDQNVDFELIFTKKPGHATKLAQKACRNHQLVAALGGDGTIREVLEGMWQSSAALGIIPGGTGNDYARGLGIPRQTASALKVLLDRNIDLLDIGIQNGKIFGVLASLGFPVDVVDYVNARRDSIFKGKLAFISALAAMMRNLKSFDVNIDIDGKRITTRSIGLFVMNMPFGGGGMKFTPEAHYNDGLFNMLLIEDLTRTELGLAFPKIYSGKHTTHPKVTIVKGRRITVEGEPRPLMLDGDVFHGKTLAAEIVPKATRIVVPTTKTL